MRMDLGQSFIAVTRRVGVQVWWRLAITYIPVDEAGVYYTGRLLAPAGAQTNAGSFLKTLRLCFLPAPLNAIYQLPCTGNGHRGFPCFSRRENTHVVQVPFLP